MANTIDKKFKEFNNIIEKAVKNPDVLKKLHCPVWVLKDLPPIFGISDFILKSGYGGVRPYHDLNVEEKQKILVAHGAKRCAHMDDRHVLDTYRNIYDVLLETGRVLKTGQSVSYETYQGMEAVKN